MNLDKMEMRQLRELFYERDCIINSVLKLHREASEQTTLEGSNELLSGANRLTQKVSEYAEAIENKIAFLQIPPEEVMLYVNSEYGLFPDMEIIIENMEG